MMFALRFLIPTFAFLLLGTSFKVAAQADTWTEPQVIKQPAPVSVKGVDRTGVYGTVSIKVAIDTTGTVFTAEFVEGPGWSCPSVTNSAVATFREAARQAALKAKFIPAKHNSETIFSSAILTYQFSKPPQKKSSEKKSEARLDRLTQLGGTDAARIDRPSEGSTAGVLNDKALSLDKPVYPSRAKLVRAGGPVGIQVLIDEDGTVLSAEPVSGHPLLQASARSAACKARFTPTLLSGKPVKVAGMITYNFVP